MRHNLLLISAAIALILAATYLIDKTSQPSVALFENRPEVTQVQTRPAPDFTFTALGHTKPTSLASLKGKIVLLNFWASWCAPCVIEFPKLAELAKSYPDQLVVLAVSADTNLSDINRFLSRNKHQKAPNFLIVHDEGKQISQDLFQTIRLPETIIIDPEGQMVRKVVGDTDWTGDEMRSYLLSLVEQRPLP